MSRSAPARACLPAETVVSDRAGTGMVVGRDPAGTTWLVVRYAEDWDPAGWTHARLADVVFDPGRGVLELATLPPAALRGGAATGLLPAVEIASPDGTRYRSAPSRDLVLYRPPTAADWTPLPCLGGRGQATGRLRRPQGLAWDPRGYLLVADAGNHRVLVVRPGDGSVLTVLGFQDQWGQYCAGIDGGAMTEPVDVAVDPCTCRVTVADRGGGRVHSFDSGFAWCCSFIPTPSQGWPIGREPCPIAIAVADDGSLLIADARWPRLLHADADGRPMADVPLQSTDHPRFVGLRLAESFAPEGTAVLGPLDSGLHGVRWHDVCAEVEVPAGAALSVQTWASDDPTAEPPPAVWAPAKPVPIDGRDPTSEDIEVSRLVQSDWSRWQTWVAGDRLDPAPSPTDRGRYLWLCLRLSGLRRNPGEERAINTPSLAGLRLRYPRPSWLDYLPGHWSRHDDTLDSSGALFIERFLALFEGVLTDLERRYEDMPRLLDYRSAPEPWLSWLASWLDLAFDPSWPIAKRRQLVGEAVSLYRKRGTPSGLARLVEIYTGWQPEILESFRLRPPTDVYALGGGETLGCTPLAMTRPVPGADPNAGAHHFTLYVYLDGGDDPALAEAVVRRIVETERPAHTSYDLRIVLPQARVGLQSQVGLDLVLGHGIDADATLGGGEPPLRLGAGPPLSTPGADRSCRSPRIDAVGVSLDNALRLT